MPKVIPRPKSLGELAEAKRLADYWLAREAKKRPGMHPNKNTVTMRPSKFALSEWANENESL